MQVLPGSANLIGGRSVVLKVVPSRTVQGMKFPGAKYGLKMACGENPKRVYSDARPVDADGQCRRLSRRLDRGGALPAPAGTPGTRTTRAIRPTRDLGLETLAEVLRGNILVHNHCYRADEMAQMIDIAKEFGYQIRAFHHGVEAYKIAALLAKEGISASLWADWGGFKMEAIDAIKANLAIVARGRRPRDRSTPTIPRDRSGSIRKLPRQWRPAAPPAFQSPRTRRSSGSRSTRRGRSASTTDRHRSRSARTPTSCSGRRIRSASTRAPRRSGSMAR